MLKFIFYLSLTAVGLIATFRTPLAGAMAALAAYLLNPAVIVGEDYGVRFQLLTTVAFLLSWLLYRPQGLAPAGRESAPLLALWLFVSIGFLSSFWAVYSSRQALDAIFEVFKTVLLISVLVRVVRDERDMAWVMITCLVGAFHAALAHTFGVRFGYISNAYGREFGVLPDGQTPVMVLFTPLALLMAMLAPTRKERLLSWFVLPFVLNSVVSTYMRTGFVSLAMQVSLIFLFLPKRIFLRMLPVMVAGLSLFLFRLTPEDYWQRMGTLRAPREEASANSRFVINEASRRIFMDYPMGVGYRNYLDVSPRYLPQEFLTEGRRSAHNSFFSVICETGVFGFAAWLSAFLGAAWLCRRIRKRADLSNLTRVDIYAMAIEIGLYGWLVGGWFQADHEVDPAYWFVAFAVILTRLHRQFEAQKQNAEPEGGHKEFVQAAAY